METIDELSKLGQNLEPGLYQHFKGGKYEVLSVARHSEAENEEFVVYKSLQTGQTWIRPLTMFVENVERDGYKGQRFTFISPKKVEKTRPKVGLGIYITDGKGRVVFMQRKSAHEPGTWCPPGGHLEMGQSFLECAKMEVKEEVGMDIGGIEFLGAVNNIFSPDKHYINVDFVATGVTGTPILGEPDKASDVGWYELDNLPKPFLLSVENLFLQYPETLGKLRKFNSLG